MKRRNFYIFLYLFFFLLSNSEALSKYFFYEVATDSSKAYIFGSIHFGKAEWYPFESYIEKAFEKSDVIATEIDINKVSQFTFINKMIANDTIDLKYKLKPENYAKVEKSLEKVGLNKTMIQRFRPWFVAFTLQQMELSQGSINSKDGVDIYFTKKANELNKPIISLEEIEFQISLLEKFDDCADEIIEHIGINDTKTNIDKMTKAWLKGDDKIINELMNKDSDMSERYVNILNEILFKRNISMANSIIELLKEKKTYFIVVGAAHLVGNESIIEHLKKSSKKYKIKRL